MVFNQNLNEQSLLNVFSNFSDSTDWNASIMSLSLTRGVCALGCMLGEGDNFAFLQAGSSSTSSTMTCVFSWLGLISYYHVSFSIFLWWFP